VSSRSVVVFALFALLAGTGAAAWYDATLRAKVHEREESAATRRAELQKFGAIPSEVEHYQTEKERLQQQIDVINRLMQGRTTWTSRLAVVQRLASLPRVVIERVVIADSVDLTFASPEQAAAAAAALSQARFPAAVGPAIRTDTTVARGAELHVTFKLEDDADDE
jgi:hypothetical protein